MKIMNTLRGPIRIWILCAFFLCLVSFFHFHRTCKTGFSVRSIQSASFWNIDKEKIAGIIWEKNTLLA